MIKKVTERNASLFNTLDRSSFLAALAIVIFALSSLFPRMAAALEEGLYTETEKVGFAFHTLARLNPDFKMWVRSTERYQKAFPIDRAEMLHNDTYRLQNGFSAYQPDIDLIMLSFEAGVQASKSFKESQKAGITTKVSIKFSDLPENYFPFPIGDMWIAIVIKDWDKIINMTMDGDQYKEFSQAMKLDVRTNRRSRDVHISLKIRPLSVDTSTPLTLDGIDMWLMLAEIGEITMWHENYERREYLWSYASPWYVSKGQKELLELYGK